MNSHSRWRRTGRGSNEPEYAADAVHTPEDIVQEEPESGYMWCRECERVFRYGQVRVVDDRQLCPFTGCDGELSGALTWEIRRTHHPAFPKYPIEGNRYKRGC